MLASLPLALVVAFFSSATEELRSFDDYPETRIDYFTVEATSAKALRAELRRKGPSKGSRHPAHARAFYTFDWSAKSAGPNRCKASIRLRTSITFPRHSNPSALSPELRREWTRFIRDLEHHELGHIEIAYETLPKFKAALENGACAGAQARSLRVDAELRGKQEAFDADPANRVLGPRDP